MSKNNEPIFSKSEKFNEEYCTQIVKVGRVEPLENSDRLAKAVVGSDYQVVVGRDDVKEGQIMIYCKFETVLNEKFLSVNNQFELSERHKNANAKEVEELMQEGKEEEAKRMVGYFNKNGRVRIVRLRGCPSEGVLFPIESFVKWKPQIAQFDFDSCFQPDEDGIVKPFNFDTCCGELFSKVYMPPLPQASHRGNGRDKRNSKYNKRLLKFDRLIEGQFRLHVDTLQLRDNMWRFNPDTNVLISKKMHGTSVVIANVLVKFPHNGLGSEIYKKRAYREYKGALKMPTRYYWQRNVKKARLAKLKEEMKGPYTVKYGNVTSSRKVIKNEYINPKQTIKFFDKDNYMLYGNRVYPLLKPGMTLYGEICGWYDGTASPIQKGYDYGCEVGKSFLMPYRITETDPDGNVKEWELIDVYNWTLEQMKIEWVKDWLRPLIIFYHGRMGDLYPQIDPENHWNENVLQAMREDGDRFGMEKDDPTCKTKVPQEGIVIRIDNDSRVESFKLKSVAFALRESKEYDSGNVDQEAAETYGSEV